MKSSKSKAKMTSRDTPIYCVRFSHRRRLKPRQEHKKDLVKAGRKETLQAKERLQKKPILPALHLELVASRIVEYVRWA